MEQKWFMAGTESTGEYLVLAVSPLGRLGVRDFHSAYRVRLEPTPEGSDKIAEILTRELGWKQPGDQDQNRFSFFSYDAEELKEALKLGLKALGAGIEFNPDLSNQDIMNYLSTKALRLILQSRGFRPKITLGKDALIAWLTVEQQPD